MLKIRAMHRIFTFWWVTVHADVFSESFEIPHGDPVFLEPLNIF